MGLRGERKRREGEETGAAPGHDFFPLLSSILTALTKEASFITYR